MKIHSHLILFGLIVSACTSARSIPPAQSPDCQTPIEWKIDFAFSGGIAGQSKSLTISSSGNAIGQDLRKGEKHESIISQDGLRKIAGMLAQACPFGIKDTNNLCADCFGYKLIVSMNGRQYSFEGNDLNIPENIAPLIGYLRIFISK